LGSVQHSAELVQAPPVWTVHAGAQLHGPKPWPPATQVCVPLPPPAQAHACTVPAVQPLLTGQPVQLPNELPAESQVWTPLPPPGQAHGCVAPGVHTWLVVPQPVQIPQADPLELQVWAPVAPLPQRHACVLPGEHTLLDPPQPGVKINRKKATPTKRGLFMYTRLRSVGHFLPHETALEIRGPQDHTGSKCRCASYRSPRCWPAP
jgi:hypothetical protein